jgi:hypothetical protein
MFTSESGMADREGLAEFSHVTVRHCPAESATHVLLKQLLWWEKHVKSIFFCWLRHPRVGVLREPITPKLFWVCVSSLEKYFALRGNMEPDMPTMHYDIFWGEIVYQIMSMNSTVLL